MKKKTMISLLTVVVFLVPALTGCGGYPAGSDSSLTVSGGNSEATEATTFSYWISQGEDGYYSDYSSNPAINYMIKCKKWGTNKDKTVKFNFTAPPAGSAQNSFNTMVGTGDLSDIMDATYVESIADMYNNGQLLDLTSYVENDMPNYKAWLAAHPDYAKTATNNINGEKKYLQLYSYHDAVDPVWGYQYRRDWLVKYGVNPKTNASFTGGWDTDGKWNDDVIFPSGGADPLYISDWEWMFGIFDKARAGEGITDGYDISLYYCGYFEPGDLVDAFGGHGPMFYNDNGTIKFGATSDDFRVYLQTMNNWYNKNWLDKRFTDHTSEMYWLTDTSKVHSGRVGMWYGQTGSLGNGMDISEGKENSADNGYTKGICVFAAPQPINTTYGSGAQKNVTPYNFYATSREYTSVIISASAQNKDLDALFSIIDYWYSDEGAYLLGDGLNKEQVEESKDPIYAKYGLDRAYDFVDVDGNLWVEGTSTGNKYFKLVDQISNDGNKKSAMSANRIVGRQYGTSNMFNTYSPEFQHANVVWTQYEAKGNLLGSLTGQMQSAAAAKNSAILVALRDFMNKRTPNFINGSYDISSDIVWKNYTSALKKYGSDTYVANIQNVLDMFK